MVFAPWDEPAYNSQTSDGTQYLNAAYDNIELLILHIKNLEMRLSKLETLLHVREDNSNGSS